ncbi:MAG: replication-associated recombination protein A [Solirubrobacteraceae bacterium]
MDEQMTLGGSIPNRNRPLAERMRPRTLDEVVGQPQLTAPGSPLRVALESGAPHSMVLWGPPGTGKTTIALCVAAVVDAEVEQLNAVTDGIKELRAVIARAEQRRATGGRTLLFIDEIARWNKAQQDALLPYVENGTVVLVGSTTENPGFELNRALVSRLQLHVVLPLGDPELTELANRALGDSDRGVGIADGDDRPQYELQPSALEHLLLTSGGDARRLLGTIERAAQLTPGGGTIALATIEKAAGQRAVAYDKGADEHYAVISAFIKSIRGSDPDAALYWLARMEAGGEAPEFVARRLVISASEEVGVAASGALTVAVSGMQAVKMIGPPECWLHLAHVTAYLARAPKSWAAYKGLGEARRLVSERPHYPVPAHLRNAATAIDRRMGIGDGYIHASQPGGEAIEFLPEELRGTVIYTPSGNGQDR